MRRRTSRDGIRSSVRPEGDAMTGQETTAGARPVRAPRGTVPATAAGWPTEAPLRMLQNNLDPEVAEHPDRLVVYGGTGKAARDWRSFDAIVRALTELKLDETFAAVAAKRFGGTLAGTITLTGGLGGMGGAQPLAVTMNDGVAICIDVDASRIQRRIEHGYLDVSTDSMDEALRLAVEARDARRPLSIGLLGNAASLEPQLLVHDAPIDIVTDQTSAHDPLSYLPIGVEFDDWHDYAARKPEEFTGRARASMARHVAAMVGFMGRGAEVFDYGNSIRGEAKLAGYNRAFDFPGFVPAYIRPLFCEGKGPFRWVALSGDPADIARTDKAVLDLFPENKLLARWMRLAQERIQFQGLPARICWLGFGERAKFGLAINDLVKSGEITAPIVIGRDHLDTGSV